MNILLTESSIETLAGGFAGICQVLVGHPFDTIKVCTETNVIYLHTSVFLGQNADSNFTALCNF